MTQTRLRTFLFIILVVFLPAMMLSAHGEFQTAYPGIPRIDIHTHAGGDSHSITNYLHIREEVMLQSGIDIAFWLNLGQRNYPITSTTDVTSLAGGRMMSAFGNYVPDLLPGLQHGPVIDSLAEAGYIGYKMWFGPYERRMAYSEEVMKYIDDDKLSDFFEALSDKAFPLISLHIADPNGVFGDRTPWCEDPVEFWRQINAFEEILKRYPDLLVLAAHGSWLVCQDAQLDYLRYLLSTYPNMYVDLAATFQYFHRVKHDNLRDFLISYADRILFGTDIGQVGDQQVESAAAGYIRCFRILETAEEVDGGYFGRNPTMGLNLPEEVLEKIYYKNALRIFPQLSALDLWQ